MTELKREDFYNTNWDVRGWSEEMKRHWQDKCFAFGFRWGSGSTEVQHLSEDYYQLWCDQDMTYSSTPYKDSPFISSKYEDVFPNYEAPRPINVIEEITQLFSEELDKVDSEVDEDERGFERLLINSNAVESEQHWVIFLKDLSNEQLQWMESVFTTDSRYTPTQGSQDVVMGNLRGEDAMSMWSNYSRDFLPALNCTVVTFNQLFKYEDEL